MPDHDALTHGLQHRDSLGRLQVRDAGTEAEPREVSGIGVPYDDPIELFGVREEFAPGSVEVDEAAMLFWRHKDPIGRVVEHRDEDGGWWHRSSISRTTAGDEAYTLARDGVVQRFSIGFEPITSEVTEHDDGSVTIRHTRVRLREVSLVPMPAYDGARLTEVRHRTDTTPEKEGNTMPEHDNATVAPEDFREVRETVADLSRAVELLADREPTDETPAETRSAGELVRAAVRDRDQSAIEALNRIQERAYNADGGTTDDAYIRDPWVRDLVRLVDEAAPLIGWFSDGPLPSEGMNLEYSKLLSNTIAVDEQMAEGDDLAYGKVSLTSDTTPVRTFGGYTELTRQEIERSSSPNILDLHFRAQAIAAGKRTAAAFQTTYTAAYDAQVTAGDVIELPATGTTWGDWLDAVVTAVTTFSDRGLAVDQLIVDRTRFRELLDFTGSDGRPMLTVSGSGSNVVGSLNVTELRGDIASLPVRLNPRATAEQAAFTNRLALRTYRGPLVRLQDENIINLSRAFSVYFYAAFGTEIPDAIVPVENATA